MKPSKNMLVSLLLLFFLFAPCTGMAAEITTAELDRLDQIFEQLESNNQEQTKKLERASDLLKRSENQINLLSEKLKQAEVSLQTAQGSLELANKSLAIFEREQKAKINRLKFERNMLLLGIGYLLAK